MIKTKTKMVIYTKEEKTLIIPEGLGTGAGNCEGVYNEGYNDGYQSGTTDGYRDGYDEGYADGQVADCGSAITEAYQSGYTEGYTKGQEDCPTCSGSTCNLENGTLNLIADGPVWTVYPTQGYDGFGEVTVNDAGYGEGKYQSGYTEGYAQGQADCPTCSGSTCNLQNGALSLLPDGVGTWYILPDDGYDGFSQFTVVDRGYANSYWQQGVDYGFENGYSSGYTDGQEDCPGCDCSSALTEAYESGYTEGYQSGYTEGLNDCSGSTDCSSAITEAYQSGYTAGVSQRCNLYSMLYITTSMDTGHLTLYPDPDYGTGFSNVGVNMDGFGEKMYNNGYNSGVTYGRGTVGTIEVYITTTNSHMSFFPAGSYPSISASFHRNGNWLGEYEFNYGQYSTPPLVYAGEHYNPNDNTCVYTFMGEFSGAPADAEIDYVYMDVLDDNLDNWGDYTVEYIRFNGQWDYTTNEVTYGGYKLMVDDKFYDEPGSLPNTEKLAMHIEGQPV